MQTGCYETFALNGLTGVDGQTHILWFWCPGCEAAHAFYLPRWTFDGNYTEPTVSPSLLCHPNPPTEGYAGTPQCHLFLERGSLKFLSDCTHKLAGQTVKLPPLPEWMRR